MATEPSDPTPASGTPASRYWERFATVVAVGGAMLAVLLSLHPRLIVADNTPTGGDFGAHVWGPAYLRDHLLPRLTGWSMDWYAGLPVYRFYMVVPALAIVALDALVPYGVAMKIVAVAGPVALPWCAWRFGRLARLPFPVPEAFAVASTIFLFDESFTIYGGNIASTMAGEYSFAIALALAVLAFGLVIRGLETGRGMVVASVVLALSALSHGIVLLFVFGGVALMLPFWPNRPALRFGAGTIAFGTLLSAFWVLPFVSNHAYMTDMKYEPRPSGATDSFWKMYFPLHPSLDALITVLAVVGAVSFIRRRNRVGTWLSVYAVVLTAAVWVARESLPVIGLLWNPRVLPFLYLVRYLLFAQGCIAACAFFVRSLMLDREVQISEPGPAPDARIDAADPTPVGADPAADAPVEPAVRTVVVRPPRVDDKPWFTVGFLAAFAIVTAVAIGFRFQELPFGRTVAAADGTSRYQWGPFSTKSSNDGFVDGWARWNFSGYEGKSAYGEYHDVVQTMARLGADPSHGCGRALWENNSATNAYGTTMGLMLLPFWTDGCIGSMEGLFFEASGTTPYHFIAAAAMSKQSSNPVRELRYDDNDAQRGVRYLRELGVRYFLGFTPEAVAAARGADGLVEVASAGPWRVFEVEGTALVVPLDVQPVDVEHRPGDPRERWLEVGTSWFQNEGDWAARPVDGGPDSWQRVGAVVDEERREGLPGESWRSVDVVVPSEEIEPVRLPPVVVSDVVVGRESVSFSVDRTGVPVLVRVSYFPNWRADGALGPWRAAPNMMVVVPTERDVRLEFGPSLRDRASYATTLAGAIVLSAVGIRARRRRR
ncbi:MAG: hypothetical protein EBU70_01140 [Actinobacteria bacterium]|nr:hypothetical protein [Actinomycetota bacterium]